MGEQRVLLVEGRQTAFDNLGNNMLWLAFIEGDGGERLTLALNDLGRDSVLIEPARLEHCNVHCNVTSNLLTLVVSGDKNADLSGQVLAGLVQVKANIVALNASNAADQNLLTNLSTHGVDQVLDRSFARWGSQQ